MFLFYSSQKIFRDWMVSTDCSETVVKPDLIGLAFTRVTSQDIDAAADDKTKIH
jgi:hypothetical protein